MLKLGLWIVTRSGSDAMVVRMPRHFRLRDLSWTSVVAVLLTTSSACGDDPLEVQPRLLSITPEAGLIVGVGETSRFELEALGDGGVAVSSAGAVWSTADPSVVSIGEDGLATGVSAGTTSISVELGGLTVTASVEVYVPPEVAEYLPGVSYFGRRDYVEYIPGELPVVISAGHGGDLVPAEIPDRTYGTLVRDTNTRELTLAVREALIDLTGSAPHVVISHLRRTKLDPNREIEEAAQGSPFAERAWEEFHGFIEQARTEPTDAGGGMYLDMHGHGHPIDRLELGYLLSATDLDRSDASLSSLAVVQQTSIREIGRTSPLPFAEVLRGLTSFGGLLEAEGVSAVPSPGQPSPGSDPYFSGGYNTRRHGSLDDTELVSGIQLEHHYRGIRDTEENRLIYADRLAVVIRLFMLEHFGYFEP